MPKRPLGSAAETAIPTISGLCSRVFHSSGVKFALGAMMLSLRSLALHSENVIFTSCAPTPPNREAERSDAPSLAGNSYFSKSVSVGMRPFGVRLLMS